MKAIVNPSGFLALIAVLLAIGILQMITPSAEAVRVRNSLIFDIVDVDELQWAPPLYPETFKLETMNPPLLFEDAVTRMKRSSIDHSSDFEGALLIGQHLAVGPVIGGAIQSDTVSTFETIMREGTGYCADFTQVFDGLAHAWDVPVREWGMSFDGFGGNGHAFNEIFDRERKQWIFIDAFYSFYVTDRDTERPLSVLEFRGRLKDRNSWPSIHVIPLSDIRFAFKSESHALEYYFRGVDQFYLWWGNNVFQYDSSPLVRIAGKISRSAEQAVAILIGVHPEIRIPVFTENEASIVMLEAVRAKALALLVAEFFIICVFIITVGLHIRKAISRHRFDDHGI